MREGSRLGVRTLLGVSIVLFTSAIVAGCDTGRVLGESCRRDDECVTGVCVGAVCREPLHLGTQDAAVVEDSATAQDAEPDAGEEAAAPEDAAPDAAEDAAPDAAEDVVEDAAAEAEQDAQAGADAADGD